MATYIQADPRQKLPLLLRSDQSEPSIFLPANLLREARRQRNLPRGVVPRVCLLDPDGDVVRHLSRTGRGRRSDSWACYHTELIETDLCGQRLGIVGCAVGAPFAVLVAEELVASGCELVIAITSAGLVANASEGPSLILIERALRGEGTSHRYLPPGPWVDADPALLAAAEPGLATAGIITTRGITWTTDAPFRETPSALAEARAAGAVAVEMESAALLALATFTGCPIVCLAHVTNEMAQIDGDFDKGPTDGAEQALAVAAAVTHGVLGLNGEREDDPCSR